MYLETTAASGNLTKVNCDYIWEYHPEQMEQPFFGPAMTNRQVREVYVNYPQEMVLYTYGFLNHSMRWAFSDQNKHNVLQGRLGEKYAKLFFEHPACVILHCWTVLALEVSFINQQEERPTLSAVNASIVLGFFNENIKCQILSYDPESADLVKRFCHAVGKKMQQTSITKN